MYNWISYILYEIVLIIFRISNGLASRKLFSGKSMSVTDYEEKFSELVRLVPFIQEDKE
ncbi:hypothetical protein ACOSP7_032106 [Xanthoceras sorbifolium]